MPRTESVNTPGKQHIKAMVDLVVNEGLPVVVCIHPEWEFKTAVLSSPKEFSRFLVFLEDIGRFLAAGWGPRKLVLQLMTEPGGNAMDWNVLQHRMWQGGRAQELQRRCARRHDRTIRRRRPLPGS